MSIMDNVHAFQQDLDELGVSPKSVEQRIAEAVAAERERCAKRVADNADYRAMEAADPDATARVRRDQRFAAAVLWEAAADIRARTGEGEQG